MGFKTSKSYGQMSDVQMSQRRQLMRERETMRRQNDEDFFGNGDNARNAINGQQNQQNQQQGNQNNQRAPGQGENLVNNAINNQLNH